MSLNINTFNVLPFYTSIDQWYDKRPTYAGVHSHIYMGNGHIPFTQLSGNLSSLSLSVSVATASGTNIDGTYTSSNIDWNSVVLSTMGSAYTIVIQQQTDGRYYISLTIGVNTYYGYHTSLSGIYVEQHRYFTKAQMQAGHVYFCVDGTTLFSEVNITGLLSSAVVSGATLSIVNCSTGVSTDITALFPITADIIPSGYANENMRHVLSFGGANYASYKIGSHYLVLVVDGDTYYSDVFQFVDNTDDMIMLSYRRSVPIVTTRDYFSFTKGATDMHMRIWLPSPLVTPPYEFEEEMQRLDGYEFVTKRVSYMKHHTELTCSSLFANALRLLWHCNDVRMIYGTIDKDVDYVDAPQVAWEESNHLCVVDMDFKTDTIIQTNGELKKTSTISTGAYNNSFNISFTI